MTMSTGVIDIPDGPWINAEAQLQESGSLEIKIHAWNENPIQGYGAFVTITLKDETGKPLYDVGPIRYHVDKRIPLLGGNYDQKASLPFQLPPVSISRVRSITCDCSVAQITQTSAGRKGTNQENLYFYSMNMQPKEQKPWLIECMIDRASKLASYTQSTVGGKLCNAPDTTDFINACGAVGEDKDPSVVRLRNSIDALASFIERFKPETIAQTEKHDQATTINGELIVTKTPISTSVAGKGGHKEEQSTATTAKYTMPSLNEKESNELEKKKQAVSQAYSDLIRAFESHRPPH